GDIEAALRTWGPLLARFRALHDDLSVARTLANLGCCYLARNELGTAEQLGQEAGRLLRKYGAETEVLRTQWAFGRAHLRRGDSDMGIELLTRVAAEFRSRGVVVLAAEVELDVIGEFLVRERLAEAAVLARSLVAFFPSVGATINT